MIVCAHCRCSCRPSAWRWHPNACRRVEGAMLTWQRATAIQTDPVDLSRWYNTHTCCWCSVRQSPPIWHRSRRQSPTPPSCWPRWRALVLAGKCGGDGGSAHSGSRPSSAISVKCTTFPGGTALIRHTRRRPLAAASWWCNVGGQCWRATLAGNLSVTSGTGAVMT